jgi:hypothetical protein|tara:strand:+ start:3309 stop:4013 length:705 start_codon:yes stop_codon:yes gene_type:complete
MVEHADILSAEAHEPKSITNATTGDNGKIITPSSATNAISVLELPKAEKLDSEDSSAGGNAAAGVILEADGSGGTQWYPAGHATPVAGSVYGAFGHHGSSETTAIAVATTYVDIDEGWSGALAAKPLNGMTFSAGTGFLTATHAGTYELTATVSVALAAGTNDNVEVDFQVDGAVIGEEIPRLITATTDVGVISVNTIHALTAAQTVGLAIRNNTTTANLDITAVSVTAIRLGP